MDKDGSGVGPIGRGAPRARDAPGPGQAIVMRLPTVDTVGLRYILGRIRAMGGHNAAARP